MNMPLNLRIALSSLATHKLRAILAMLGVFLGALAFTGVQHVSMMMAKAAEVEVEKLGPNLYAVMAGKVRFSRRGNGIRVRGNFMNFKVSDAIACINGTPSIIDGTPFVSASMPVRGNGTTLTATIMASWSNYPDLRSFHPDIGRFFTADDVAGSAKVVTLGRKVAERLFGQPELALGRTVFIYRAAFKVIGVMEPKGRDLSGDDQDEIVFMPLPTYMRRASNQNWINGVFLRAAKGADPAAIRESLDHVMRKRHKLGPDDPPDFTVLSAKDAIKLQQQALDLVQTLGGITATVSFGVGGLGILSIMVLVVRARRVEIGVRRAVGATRSDIVRQFLLEAALMSGAGGLAGVLLCVIMVLVVSAAASFPVVIDMAVLVGTLLGASLLGVGAGAYPAARAAQVEVLDVLKE